MTADSCARLIESHVLQTLAITQFLDSIVHHVRPGDSDEKCGRLGFLQTVRVPCCRDRQSSKRRPEVGGHPSWNLHISNFSAKMRSSSYIGARTPASSVHRQFSCYLLLPPGRR